MSNRIYNPASMPAPLAAYSHAAAIPAGVRMLHSAGQTGRWVDDGPIPTGFREQAKAIWQRLTQILSEGGMEISDIVKINFFLTNANDVVTNREVFTEVLGAHRPPTTLLVVKQLALPELKLEIEVVAAQG